MQPYKETGAQIKIKAMRHRPARETIGRLHLLIELYFGVNLTPAYGAQTKVDPTLTARLQNQFQAF